MNGWSEHWDEENNEVEVDNELVFYDDDLTWGDVARASGVGEPITYTRSKRKSTATATTSRGQNQTPTIQVVNDEDNDNDEKELDIEEDNGKGGASDETLDLDAKDDEFDIWCFFFKGNGLFHWYNELRQISWYIEELYTSKHSKDQEVHPGISTRLTPL